MLRIALLDDYANPPGVAMDLADWGRLGSKAQITAFRDHLTEDQAAEALQPFDVLCTIRERMALPRTLIQRLPNLKLITIIGARLTNLDLDAASEHGVIVAHSGTRNPAFATIGAATPELTWGLLIATVRDIAGQDRRMRQGLWQDRLGMVLGGKTLGLLGLGRIGKQIAKYGKAFGMEVIAWSQKTSDRRSGRHGRRAAGGEGRAFRPGRRRLDPPGAERSHSRPGHGARTGADEAHCLPDQHLARPDRGRG